MGKRADGYHNIETVFYPIPLCDELDIEEAEADSFEISGIPLDGNKGNNLVLRTIRLLRDRGYAVPPLRVSLRKNIPSSAGLGGGSSDAAFTMRMLNDMFSLGIGAEEMKRLVSSIGADCAFFVDAKPVFAEGIGNVLSPINTDLSGLFLVLIKPSCIVSTAEAYAGVTPRLPSVSVKELAVQDPSTWRDAMVNDFEQSIFPLHPEIASIKEELYRHGAIYASMSGSGSSIFGLFRKLPSVEMPAPFFNATFAL